MTTERKPSLRTLKVSTIARLYSLLQSNIVKNEDGTVSYLNDMDDTKIAEAVGDSDITLWHVRSTRQDEFGRLRHSPGDGALATRVDAIEARLARLERRFEEILGEAEEAR